MSFRRVLAATALVSTVSLAGCAETDSIEDLEEPPVVPMSGGGSQSGGNNGGSSDDLQTLEAALVQATNVPLLKPGTNKPHLGIALNLLPQPGGPGIFSYAVQCGLRAQPGLEYVEWSGMTFPAKGHLRSTDNWQTGPLDATGRNDLFACMAALMNPFGAHVDVLFTGARVRDDGLPHPDFDLKEAGWAAQVIGGTVYYTVWPTEEFIQNCDGDPASVFETRVCGNLPDDCNFVPGGVFETDCQPLSSGGYACEGQTVLVTYLRSSDFLTLNPACESGP